jgi:hypothetical protein
MTGLPTTVRLRAVRSERTPDTSSGFRGPVRPQADIASDRASLDDPRYRRTQLAALLAVPLIQLAVNPAAFLNPGADDYLDPWVYTGFFLSLPAHLEHWGFTYYSTRLSWILPGFAAHRLLPPLAANYTLHLAFFYALLWVTSRFLASGAGRHVAMLGTLLVAWSPAILMAIGWDYVDGAGILYLMATLLCIERALSGSHAAAWSVAAGCAVACLLTANVVLVLLLPACGIFLFLRARGSGAAWRLRPLAAALGAALAGAIVTLAVFAAVNRGLGGQWLFLTPSFQFAVRMLPAPNPWRSARFSWQQVVWLVAPACAGAGAILSLAARAERDRAFSRPVQAAFLTAAATWVIMDSMTTTALLQHRYYVSYLVPLALVALPLQAGQLTAVRGWRAALTVELAVYAALAIVHVGFLWYGTGLWTRVAAMAGPAHPPDRLAVITVAAASVGLVAVVVMRFAARSAIRGMLVVAGLAFVFAAPHVLHEADEPDARARFRTVTEAHRFIGTYIDKSATRFWYRLLPHEMPPFRSIASTYLWGWVLVNEDMPLLTTEQVATLRPGTHLVLLLNREEEQMEARAALRRFGFDYSVVALRRFGAGSQAYSVLVAELGRLPQTSTHD